MLLRPLLMRVAVSAAFLPTIIAYVNMWGDPRTSAGYEFAPMWFNLAKNAWFLILFCVLIFPLRFRITKSATTAIFLALVSFALLLFTNPVLEGEQILVRSLFYACALVLLLSVIKSSLTYDRDLPLFVFHLFWLGFVVQILMLYLFGIVPSHSIDDIGWVRFNGVTNDSLATALILPAFIPSVIEHRARIVFGMILIMCGILTGSTFAAVLVPTMLVIYAFYRRFYRTGFLLVSLIGILLTLFLNTIVEMFADKYYSIITHLRFFLNVFDFDLAQPSGTCSEEFCESFLEASLHLSVAIALLFYLALGFTLLRLARLASKDPEKPLGHTILFLGLSLFIASFVHPVPLIPFALMFFIISVSVYFRQGSANNSKLVRNGQWNFRSMAHRP